MAKFEKNKQRLDYAAEIKKLNNEGAKHLYLLYGEEDYLREMYLTKLRQLCLDGEGDDFNYKRLDGPVIDLGELDEAINAVPFFSEHTFVEVRGFDINACREKDAERLKDILSDIPDFCTVVFVIGVEYSLDGRLAAAKTIKKLGYAIEFTAQDSSKLTDWIAKRFAALGKTITRTNAEQLVFTSGSLMNRLIPEIEKIASFATSSEITAEDIRATAQRIPEADVFEMTELIGQGRYDKAMAILSELLHAKEHPIMLLALIGNQMRRLYAAKLAAKHGRSRDEIMELCSVTHSFIADKLITAAKNYTLEQLEHILVICVDYDFRMKSGGDAEQLIKEFIARIAGDV
ncbi:MAG: DNA polymerase III subunit delta [Oscillospiraceae bacterium]|nr:DNA polymerase III subunit delta [Oscillospiraceae bacterium]